MRLVTRMIVYWLSLGVAVIFALLLLMATAADKVAGPVASQILTIIFLSAIFLLLLAILYSGVQAVCCTVRYWEVSHCRGDQQFLDRVAGELDSPFKGRRRYAVQVLSDFFEEPFGPVSCWPVEFFPGHGRVARMAGLLKAWWAARAGYTGAAVLRLQTALGTSAPASGPFRPCHVGAEMNLREFPPLPVEEFVERLRPAMERTLLRVAAFVNTVPQQHGLGDADARIAGLFALLQQEAVSVAWDLRFRAGEPAPTTGPDPLETWGEKYSRIRAAEAGLPPSPKVVETWVEKFRGLELAPLPVETPAGDTRPAPDSPSSLKWKDWMETARNNFSEALDRMADSVKDAVLDWPGEEEAETTDLGTAVIPAAEFARAMGGQIEESLRLVVEAVNQPGTDRRVRELMADLLLHALTFAREVRTGAAPDHEHQPC